MSDAESIARILESIGVQVVGVQGDNVNGLCPGHLGRVGRLDTRPSWSMSISKKVHYCFSCGYRGTLVGLVAESRGLLNASGSLDYEAARRYVEDNAGMPMSEVIARLDRVRDPVQDVYRPMAMSEARLSAFCPPPQDALRDRRLKSFAAEMLGVLWDARSLCWILPLRGPETGRLLGWQEKGHQDRYFRNRPAGLRKSATMFGIRDWSGPLMAVVESPLDAVRLTGLGYPSVATCGSQVSPAQYRLMRRAERLVLAFDNPSVDAAGRTAFQHAYALSRQEGFEFWSFKYDSDRKDVGDMDDEEIHRGMEHAVHCVRGAAA